MSSWAWHFLFCKVSQCWLEFLRDPRPVKIIYISVSFIKQLISHRLSYLQHKIIIGSMGKFFILILRVFILFLFMCVYISSDTCSCQKEHLIPWSWSYRPLWTSQHGCWEPNSTSLKEQQVLFPAETSLQGTLISFLRLLNCVISTSSCASIIRSINFTYLSKELICGFLGFLLHGFLVQLSDLSPTCFRFLALLFLYHPGWKVRGWHILSSHACLSCCAFPSKCCFCCKIHILAHYIFYLF